MSPLASPVDDHGASRELVIATRNRGKLVELRALLAPLGRPIVDLSEAGIPPSADEELLEDGDTFEANARAKARYFARLAGGRAVLADDSGLSVAALEGAPGVRSRRYAGVTGTERDVSEANSRLLLRALGGVTDRRAEFICAVAFVDRELDFVTLGRTAGHVLSTPRGVRGFGYDPLFWSDELQMSFGEASEAQKAQVSHRARAVAATIARIKRERVSEPFGR